MKEINKDRYSDAAKDMKAFQVGFPRGNAGSRKSGGGRGPRHRRANNCSGTNAGANRNGASRSGKMEVPVATVRVATEPIATEPIATN